MAKRAGYIYALLENNQIRYIGQTTNLLKRYSQHCSLAQNQGHTKRQLWLSSLLKQGIQPVPISLLTTEDMDRDEVYLIRKYKSKGYDLVNMADGGKDMSHTQRAKKLLPWKRSPLQVILPQLKRSEAFCRKHNLGVEAELHARERYIRAVNSINKVGKDNMNAILWSLYGKENGEFDIIAFTRDGRARREQRERDSQTRLLTN